MPEKTKGKKSGGASPQKKKVEGNLSASQSKKRDKKKQTEIEQKEEADTAKVEDANQAPSEKPADDKGSAPTRKSERRKLERDEERKVREEEKKKLEEKYDVNLRDSDDSSDEEVLLRTGNIPKFWYDLYDHKGYTKEGKQMEKMVEKDELQKFIEKSEDPQWWRNIVDDLNNKQVRLSRADLDMIMRIRKGKVAERDFDLNKDYSEFFEGITRPHPIQSQEPKRRFVPSKWERLKVQKFLKALKEGRMKTLEEKKKEREERLADPDEQNLRDLWADETIVPWKPRGAPRAIPAPKRDLPTHAESFNPPNEYLFDEKEKEQYDKMDESDRPINYVPQQFECLRKVPLYESLVQENFERCLDLYMCPRMMKKKVNVVDPKMLIPELPSPNDLRPFPLKVSIEYNFHQTCVRCISVSPCGNYLATGDEDHNVVVWQVRTARILRKYKVESEVIDAIEWCPSKKTCLLAVANAEHVYIFQPKLYSKSSSEELSQEFTQWETQYNIDAKANELKEKFVSWSFVEDGLTPGTKAIKMKFQYVISKLIWHPKGDYFATMANNIQTTSQVMIHSLRRTSSNRPFTKSKGIVQAISFHPTRPNFFACTHVQVFQYNLQKQMMVAKYQTGSKWISSIDVHPGGDNFIIGTYDKKIHWFDMDMGGKPYKNLKYHDKAIRNVRYCPAHPLFSSCSDDGTVNIFYGKVYDDLLQNAMIVPVKILRAHDVNDKTGLGAMDCKWHPTQPWIFTSGSEGKVKLWV